MQRQTLLVSIAVFALLASAIWFFAARAPAPAARVAMVPALAAAAPASNAVAPIPSTTPPAAAPVIPAVPTTAPASAATVAPAAVSPVPADADQPSAAAVDPAADATAAPGEGDSGTTDGAAPVASDAPASTEASAPDTSDGTDAPAAPGEHNAAAAPGNAPKDERAVDLFAERIAALEDRHDDRDAPDARAAAAQRAYEERDEGGDAAKAAQPSVRDAFAAWLGGLQFDDGHPSLIAVDCRSGACRVLIAQSGVDFDGAAQLERESPVNAFTRELVGFTHSTTLSEAGWELIDFQMSAAGGGAGASNDIALWTIYLRVPAATPANP